jgi:hypothetical protein
MDSLTLQQRTCGQSIMFRPLDAHNWFQALTLEFEAMLDQRIHDQTTYPNKKYERLIVDYE